MFGRLLATLALTVSLVAQLDPELLSGLRARSIGPAGMSGRVAAVDAVVKDPDVIWVGAATGGVWKSVNGGVTFAPVFDDQLVAAVGAVAIFQPSPDVVWVGTGEGNPRNSASVGNGVYRTLDGGKTWQHLGLAQSERIARIVLHPHDRDVAYVAAMGPTWGDGEQRGVFKTTDGGQTWNQVLAGDLRTGCADLVMDPANPDKLFAALWEHRRWPHFFKSGGPASGLFVTHDAGTTWQRLHQRDGMPEGELGRIGLAIAASDPRVVYALIEATKNTLLRSDDGGVKWRSVNQQRNVAPRPFYYTDIRVDPERPDRVYNLASTLTVSNDGGKSFTTLAGWEVHPDHHALWIHPHDPTLLIGGNDGGIVISHDRGQTWRFVANLPLAQFYHVHLDNDTPYHIHGGLQDNGSWRGPSSVWENGGIRNQHWEEVGFGDGFATVPDPQDSLRGYAMSQGGYLHRYDRRTGQRRSIRPTGPEGVELRFNWNAAIALDPFVAGTLYYGSQFVHRSTDRGDSWVTLSPDLTVNDPQWQKQDQSGGLTLDVTGAENYGSLLTIAPSPVTPGVIWTGSDDGRIHLTRDQGGTWTSVEANVPAVPAHTWIPHIEPSRFDPAEAFVVFDDHRRNRGTTWVYRTRDYGQTWTDLGTPELRGYALRIVQDPVQRDLLFLGTEFGLWFTPDGGKHWTQLEHGLPTVSCMALAIHPRDHDLVVGTHGRALFVFDDIRVLRTLSAETTAKRLHLFPVPDAQQHQVKQTGGSRFPGAGEFRGDNRPYGALITYWAGGDDLFLAKNKPAPPAPPAPKRDGDDEPDRSQRLKVEVHDAAGQRIAKFEQPVVRGVNRFAWNLRRDAFRRPHDPDDDRPRARGPDGPEVPAGDYRLSLTLGDQKVETSVKVLADPRVTVAEEARAEKWRALEAAGHWQELATEAIERLDEARADLDSLVAKAKRAQARADSDDKPHQALLQLVEATKKALDDAEIPLRGRRDVQGIPARKDALNRLGEITSSLQSSWEAPDATQRQALEAARVVLEAALAGVNGAFAEHLPKVRQESERAGLGLLRSRDPIAAPTALTGR